MLGAAFVWLGQGDRQAPQVSRHSREYEKVTSLRAGYNLEKFREQLGSPLFVKVIRKAAGLTENTFRGPTIG
jgi:hypothetical protein